MKNGNNSATKKTCIVIAGPTAIGKTALAIQLAQHYNTEIISSDSRQCFKELNIGVAKPSVEELALVKHHFISSHSIHDNVNAATFEAYALQKVEDIFQNHDIAVMVGGTGLYIKAFCEGLDELPSIDPSIRQTIINDYNNKGIEWLREQVRQYDLPYYTSGEIYNPQRMMRALEVKLSTNRSILQYQTRQKKERPFNILKIGLETDRPTLTNRINERVDAMMAAGLTEEVEALLDYRHLNALQTVGYKEIIAFFDGDTTLNESITAIKINTRQYAKRQMTWFKKDTAVNWFAPDFTAVKNYSDSFLVTK